MKTIKNKIDIRFETFLFTFFIEHQVLNIHKKLTNQQTEKLRASPDIIFGVGCKIQLYHLQPLSLFSNQNRFYYRACRL